MRLQDAKSMRRATDKCLRSTSRAITASPEMAGLSPRAHIAALIADRAVATRRSLGSALADVMRDMVLFPFVVVQYAKEKAGPEGRRGQRVTRSLGAGAR